MKYLLPLLSFCLFIILTSCEKEVIPEPNVNAAVVNSPPLYITGDFDGVTKTIVIDDVLYSADSYLTEYPQDTIGVWGFDIYNSDSIFFPELAFQIFNHELSTSFDYSDLVESTDSSYIDFADAYIPVCTHLNDITVMYSPTQSDHYFSELSPINNPLNVLDAKDTIVGGQQYRILELSGNIMLTHLGTSDEISINNFHARIAFSL